MDIPKTVTKVFITNYNKEIPGKIDVLVKIPIEGRKNVVNCYTTGRSVPYLIRKLEYGLESIVFAHYSG